MEFRVQYAREMRKRLRELRRWAEDQLRKKAAAAARWGEDLREALEEIVRRETGPLLEEVSATADVAATLDEVEKRIAACEEGEKRGIDEFRENAMELEKRLEELQGDLMRTKTDAGDRVEAICVRIVGAEAARCPADGITHEGIGAMARDWLEAKGARAEKITRDLEQLRPRIAEAEAGIAGAPPPPGGDAEHPQETGPAVVGDATAGNHDLPPDPPGGS
jgi:hypothetical protein